jgi:FAD synthase
MAGKLPIHLAGMVTQFKGDGRRLGYPTANLVTETDLKDGIYFGFADLKDWKDKLALIFIGMPTTMGETSRRVEAHILDIPDEDYYTEPLRLTVSYFHRPNHKFENMEALIQAMQADETAARQWFKPD